jgi:hypothetical protein
MCTLLVREAVQGAGVLVTQLRWWWVCALEQICTAGGAMAQPGRLFPL